MQQKSLNWGALADARARMPNNWFPEISVGENNLMLYSPLKSPLGFTLQEIM